MLFSNQCTLNEVSKKKVKVTEIILDRVNTCPGSDRRIGVWRERKQHSRGKGDEGTEEMAEEKMF